MAQSKKPLAAALGAAFLASSIAPLASAEVNPFSAQQLSGGYDLASFDKQEDGKCGEARCGANTGEEAASDGGDKAGDEGNCGEQKAGSEGSCGDKAGGEGNCGEGKAGSEGSCGDKAGGEGSCGGGKAHGEGSCGG